MSLGRWMVCIALALASLSASAVDVGLVGVMSNKALLSINGGDPVPVPVGQTVQGVRVVSLQGDQVVVDIGGKRRPLRIGQHTGGGGTDTGASGESAGESKTTLMADGAGHFFVTGAINGVAVRFLVDTGATFVSIGSSDARRFGIDTSRGQTGISHTANGQVKVTKVKLDSVQVGEVTLHNVDAVVHGTDLPVTLLGMSFLNRMEMQREGATMTLRKRF